MRGADIKSVKVCVLLRHLVDDVSIPLRDMVNNPERQWRKGSYNVGRYLAESGHSVNNINEKILIYEPHMQPMIGQLDYLFSQG